MTKRQQKPPRTMREEEVRLWEEVRKTAKKLHKVVPRAMAFDEFFRTMSPIGKPAAKPATKPAPKKPAPPLPKVDAQTADLASLWAGRPAAKTPASKLDKKPVPKAPISTIEPRLRRRIVGGREELDARIDLHGLTQADAEPMLSAFIHRSFSRGFRTVLVITGKGRSQGSEGVLRRMVPLWLNGPALKPMIAGWDESSQNHGGAGALYVRLRRQ